MRYILLSREEMIQKFKYPALGCYSSGNIYIRKDLGKEAYFSVVAHEEYHAKDTSNDSLFMRELKANLAGFKASPSGWLECLWLTITDIERIKLYLNYFKD